MTDEQEKVNGPDPPEEATRPERFPELAELEEKIQRRLRSNQRFLERFMDEDFDDLDDDEVLSSDDDDPEQMEEL
jgi:hypothetical protein